MPDIDRGLRHTRPLRKPFIPCTESYMLPKEHGATLMMREHTTVARLISGRTIAFWQAL